MPRRDVQYICGGYYHLYNRGVARQSIFRSDENYLYLLRLLKQVATECQVAVIAYCLMPNHYHWLVRQDGETPVGDLPRRVFGSYSQAFNKAYARSGTLFEGRFRVKHVARDEYLRHLCCYIHANPVKDGIALAPELWPYSNYQEWIGARTGTLIDRAFVQQHFPDLKQYRQAITDVIRNHHKLPEQLRTYLQSLER